MTCPDIKKIGLPNASGAFVKADIGMLGDKSSRTGQKLRRFGRVFHATRIAIQMFNSGKVVVEVFYRTSLCFWRAGWMFILL